MLKKLAHCGLTILCVQSSMAYAACSDTLQASSSALFSATICSDRFAQPAFFEGDNIESLIDQLDEDELKQQFNGFNENIDTAFFQADLRGLPITISFPNAGGTKLVFEVPSLNIYEEWNGNDREASKDQFEDYLKKEGDQILKELTRVSPVDPVAGNPASLQTSMAEAEFDAGTETDYNNASSLVGIGAQCGHYTQDGKDIDTCTIPFSYTWKFNDNNALTFRVPLTYSKVNSAESYRAMLGFSYKRLVTDRWALTPSVSYGATGSVDLGAVGQIASGSLTSEYLLIEQPSYVLRMANMAGYYKTFPLTLGDYSIDIESANTILRNGLSLSIPLGTTLAGREISVDTFVVDTRFLGDELYIDQYNEIGFSIGFMKRGGGSPSFSGQDFGVGVKYVHYSQGHGFNVHAKYQF